MGPDELKRKIEGIGDLSKGSYRDPFRKRYDDLFSRDSIDITRPNDPVERRIRFLASRLASHDQGSISYDIPRIVAAAKDPAKAKQDWLVSTYQKRGWIDEDYASRLREEPAGEALSQLETVCLEKARLRSGTVVPRIQLPENDGESWGQTITDYITELGFSPEEVRIRSLETPQYKENAVRTGNDRADKNLSSYRDYHGGRDGEELARIRHGLTDASDTTYVSRGISKQYVGYNKSTPTILVYSPDALDGIGPLSFPNSNGFSAFHFGGEVKRRSLLAVFER